MGSASTSGFVPRTSRGDGAVSVIVTFWDSIVASSAPWSRWAPGAGSSTEVTRVRMRLTRSVTPTTTPSPWRRSQRWSAV